MVLALGADVGAPEVLDLRRVPVEMMWHTRIGPLNHLEVTVIWCARGPRPAARRWRRREERAAARAPRVAAHRARRALRVDVPRAQGESAVCKVVTATVTTLLELKALRLLPFVFFGHVLSCLTHASFHRSSSATRVSFAFFVCHVRFSVFQSERLSSSRPVAVAVVVVAAAFWPVSAHLVRTSSERSRRVVLVRIAVVVGAHSSRRPHPAAGQCARAPRPSSVVVCTCPSFTLP